MMMTMKNTWKIFVVSVLVVCILPLVANAQDWSSTSTLQGTGSDYTSQITPVGAGFVEPMATTTGAAPQHKAGIRQSGSGDPWGENQDPGEKDPDSPIGDAVLPLMLLLGAYCGVMYVRRKRRVGREAMLNR